MKKPVLTSTGEQCFAATDSVLLTAIGTRKSQRNRLLLFQSPLTKTLFSLFFTVSCWLWSGDAFAQWTVPQFTAPGIFESDYFRVSFKSATSGVAGTDVGGTYNYKGYISEGNDLNDTYTNSQRINTAFSTVPFANKFKVQAGKQMTIKIEFDLRNDAQSNFVFMEGYNNSYRSLSIGVGWDGQPNVYTTIDRIQGDYADNANRRSFTYEGPVTFPVGTKRGWIAITYQIYRGCCRYPATIVLPFVVEGSAIQQIPILGTTREPAIPYMVLHAPPGDKSYATFQTNREVCRTFSEAVTNSQTHEASLNVTAGIKVSGGLPFMTIDVENTITASASVGTGNTKIKTTDTQKCISVLNAVSTISSNEGGAAKAGDRTLFMGYSATVDFGVYPYVKIDATTGSAKLDTGLVFSVGAPEAFFWTKPQIIADSIIKYNLYKNAGLPDSTRQHARNQNKIWKQVLVLDSLNTINPNNEAIGTPLTLSGAASGNTYNQTVNTSTNTSLQVTHFVDQSYGLGSKNMVGGIGVETGYQFTTSKSFGSSTATSTNNSTTIGYYLEDNDQGDSFPMQIVRDPTYGTPIFRFQSGARSSCPYEGGYQRDQPRFEIAGISLNKKDTTISNVSLGTSGTFRVRACNDNTTESRSYDFGFLGQSINTDLKITSSGSEGNQLPNLPITKFVKINDIPAGGCINQTYDINMSRRHAASAMSYSNIEFQLYSECESSIKSSLFANINFAGPPPPTGVAATPSEICSGLPTTLTANCAVTTTPTWYTEVTGGFPIATGATVTVNPTANTRYYVGCETPDYKRDRIATKLVLVSTPVTNLNLTNNYTTENTFQIATQALTANNKVTAPVSAVYRAGKAITLNSGFEARNGAVFKAEIGGCN